MNMAETETIIDEERAGHTYSIIRTNAEEWTRDTGFEHEFLAYIDGEITITAGALEVDGWEKPWTDALRRYCEAHIDGLSAGGN